MCMLKSYTLHYTGSRMSFKRLGQMRSVTLRLIFNSEGSHDLVNYTASHLGVALYSHLLILSVYTIQFTKQSRVVKTVWPRSRYGDLRHVPGPGRKTSDSVQCSCANILKLTIFSLSYSYQRMVFIMVLNFSSTMNK